MLNYYKKCGDTPQKWLMKVTRSGLHILVYAVVVGIFSTACSQEQEDVNQTLSADQEESVG